MSVIEDYLQICFEILILQIKMVHLKALLQDPFCSSIFWRVFGWLQLATKHLTNKGALHTVYFQA
jgi:hypothetical protein